MIILKKIYVVNTLYKIAQKVSDFRFFRRCPETFSHTQLTIVFARLLISPQRLTLATGNASARYARLHFVPLDMTY